MISRPKALRWTCWALVMLLGVACSSTAEDRIYSVAVPLETPKKSTDKRAPQPYDSAPVSMWLPPGVKTIRGAVVNPFHEPAVNQKHWRAAVAQWDFALVGANLFGVRSNEIDSVIAGSLQQLARESGHPELAQAPMCFVGMSAGGGMSTQLTAAMPERTIAAAPVCLEVGPRDAASRQVPILTVFGERDGRQMEKLLAKLPVERAEEAQWAIAVQWGKRHEFARANNLVMPWFVRAIAHRRGDDCSQAEPPALIPFARDRGYLGLPASWDQPVPTIVDRQQFQGDLSQTCWFPDAYLAHVWQALVTPPGSPLKISQPAGMGDGGEFQKHAAHKPIEVRVNVKGGANFDSLKLYNGDRELAECTGNPPTATLTDLPPGIYSLIIQGRRGGSLAALSPPNTIIVE